MKAQANLPLAVLHYAGIVNVWDLVATLPQEPLGDGYVHLGDDGVLRSLSGSGDVLTYQQLSPEQINQYIIRFPSPPKEHFLEIYKGVDGRDVIDIAQLAHPDLKTLLPEPDEASISILNSSLRLNQLSERACHESACSGSTLCYAYTCSGCAKADYFYWGFCY